MKQEFLDYIFGGLSPVTYVAAFVFVFFGLIIKWYIQTNKAVKTNENTPSAFSWNYWLKNNLFKTLFSVFANIVIAFIALRFSTEIFNVPISMAFATVIGICFDIVIDKVSTWQGNLKVGK
jgi:uncharacterized membrane protein